MKMKASLTTTTIVGSASSNATEGGDKRFSQRLFPRLLAGGLALGMLVAIAADNAFAADDRKIVAGLDTQYQAAVKKRGHDGSHVG